MQIKAEQIKLSQILQIIFSHNKWEKKKLRLVPGVSKQTHSNKGLGRRSGSSRVLIIRQI